MNNKNKIALFNIMSTILIQGLNFFSGPIFSSTLGTDNYGIAAVYLTWVQITSTVFSLQAAGTVAVARANFPMEDQEKYQSSTLSLATLSFSAFSIFTIIAVSLLSRRFSISMPMILFGLIQAWGMYCVAFMNAKLTYEFKADRNFLLSVMISGLTIGASLFLIRCYPTEENYWGRIIGQSVIYGTAGVILFTDTIRKGKTFYKKEYWKFTLPITIPTIFHLLAHIVLNQSDKVMIQGMLSNSEAGIYALASTFSAVMNASWHAFNNSWVPFYYEYTRQNQIDTMRHHARNYIELFSIITVGFILLSPEVFHLYASDRAFWAGTDFIPLFAVGYYFVFLYSFPVNFEFYNKKTKSIAVGTVCAALLNILMNYIMIKWIGVIGAVIATMLAHGILFIFHYLNARKMKEAVFPFRIMDFLPWISGVCGSCILHMICKDLWAVRWGTGAVLGIYLAMKVIRRKEIF